MRALLMSVTLIAVMSVSVRAQSVREDCSVESKLVNATTAVGEISGLPGDQGGTKIDPVLGRRYTGSPMLRLLLAPQKDGILLGEVVIHADNAGMAGIKGSVEGTSSFEFQASFPNQAYDFKGQICGDRLSGTFVATPSGAHGTWSAAVQPWEKNHG